MAIQEFESVSKNHVLDESASATRLVASILDDATTLLSQHVAMFRAEVRQEVTRGLNAAKYLSLGLLLSSIGMLFIAVGCVPLLNYLVPSLPMWSCWAIVGGLFISLGIIAYLVGRSAIASINAVPNQTLAAIQKDVKWITNPQKS